jgi:hypothetical protein
VARHPDGEARAPVTPNRGELLWIVKYAKALSQRRPNVESTRDHWDRSTDGSYEPHGASMPAPPSA